nr:hypothetical protein [Tanacetum cinerariifolium]
AMSQRSFSLGADSASDSRHIPSYHVSPFLDADSDDDVSSHRIVSPSKPSPTSVIPLPRTQQGPHVRYTPSIRATGPLVVTHRAPPTRLTSSIATHYCMLGPSPPAPFRAFDRYSWQHLMDHTMGLAGPQPDPRPAHAVSRETGVACRGSGVG